MKLSSTVMLALALAGGVAGAAAAQTGTTPSDARSQTGYGEAQPNPAQQAIVNPQADASSGARLSAAQGGGGDDAVRQAQSRLQGAGLYNGPVDGRMDPDTRMAIARFQEQHGLARTQRLDPQTRAQLNSAQTAGSGSGTPEATQMPAPSIASTGAGDNAPGQQQPHR